MCFFLLCVSLRPNGVHLKVRFNGMKARTKVKKGTTDPSWFESLEIDGGDLMLPHDLDFCPEIVLRIWDSDGLLGKNKPVCGFHLPLSVRQRD